MGETTMAPGQTATKVETAPQLLARRPDNTLMKDCDLNYSGLVRGAVKPKNFENSDESALSYVKDRKASLAAQLDSRQKDIKRLAGDHMELSEAISNEKTIDKYKKDIEGYQQEITRCATAESNPENAKAIRSEDIEVFLAGQIGKTNNSIAYAERCINELGKTNNGGNLAGHRKCLDWSKQNNEWYTAAARSSPEIKLELLKAFAQREEEQNIRQLAITPEQLKGLSLPSSERHETSHSKNSEPKD